jgi:hypothetical protein
MSDTTARRTVSGWTVGLIVFAAAIMIMVGSFQIIAGLAAIFDDGFFAVTQNYVFDLDVTAWGWVHLLLGILLVFAGWGIFSGATWARATGMLLAILSAVSNFFFIPYYPVWSIVMIALAVAVIYALSVWDRDQARAGSY